MKKSKQGISAGFCYCYCLLFVDRRQSPLLLNEKPWAEPSLSTKLCLPLALTTLTIITSCTEVLLVSHMTPYLYSHLLLLYNSSSFKSLSMNRLELILSSSKIPVLLKINIFFFLIMEESLT